MDKDELMRELTADWHEETLLAGGKPSKQTPPDRRLGENKHLPPKPKPPVTPKKGATHGRY